MKHLKLFILASLLILLSCCQFRQDEYVDFADIEAAKGLSFQVIGQHVTDLSNGLPENCYLPDGMPVNTSGTSNLRRTNSTSGANLLQQLLKYVKQNEVIEVVGTYPTITLDWEDVRLSGKVMLPKGRKPKRMILVSHYTICSNVEAPSNCFSLEGVLVGMGYGLIIPDYMGYGVTADKMHPYLLMDITARNVLDMYWAVKEWLKAVDMQPEQDEIDIMGYSQGGANSMAVEYLIENEYSNPADKEYVRIHRVFAGGGPYDVKATYENYVSTDTASYPVAVPLVVQGMIKGNNLNIKMSDMMQQRLCDSLDTWINSKLYSSSVINELIGTRVTHELLTEEAMQQTSTKVAELYKAMTMNSITSYNWTPQASVYIMHSMDDETVPFINASNAKSKWQNANIMYNFGHYGPHVACCLRFIYSVMSLLEQEEKEMKQYE